MSQVVALVGGERLRFKCPGCGDVHCVSVEKPNHNGSKWTWNGDVVKPTLNPSVLVTSGHYCKGHKEGDDCWCTLKRAEPGEGWDSFQCYLCHSYVRDGMIQFLGDCTHKLAGQTVPLPPLDE